MPFIEFQEILANSFLQPVEAHPLVFTRYNMAYGVSATLLSFVSFVKLLRMHIVAGVHSSDLYFLSFSVRETVLKVKLAKVEINNIYCFPLTHRVINLVLEGYQVGQKLFLLRKSILTTPKHLLVCPSYILKLFSG